MRISGAGQKIELVRYRRVLYQSARLGDSTGAHAAQSGGLTHFVPTSTGSARHVGVPAAEAGSAAHPTRDRRLSARLRMPAWCSGGVGWAPHTAATFAQVNPDRRRS